MQIAELYDVRVYGQIIDFCGVGFFAGDAFDGKIKIQNFEAL